MQDLLEMRLVVDGWMTGALNMARDESLAASVASGGTPTLRLYRFRPSCISIGRFQEYPGEIDVDGCAARGIEVVRRPTGGLAILHQDDFTYSLTLPRKEASAYYREEYFNIAAAGIIEALGAVGVPAGAADHPTRGKGPGTWCFDSAYGVDLEWRGRKVCGSAQRVGPGSVLQHGSVFLSSQEGILEGLVAVSPEAEPKGTPQVSLEEAAGSRVSWERLADAFAEGFARALAVTLVTGTLDSGEDAVASKLRDDRYAEAGWLAGTRR